MVLKSASTSYKASMNITRRHQRVGVGETYQDRMGVAAGDNALKGIKSEPIHQKRSFLGRLKDVIFGHKSIHKTIGQFAPNAAYITGYTIPSFLKDVENGVKGKPATDTELIDMLGKIEKQFSES